MSLMSRPAIKPILLGAYRDPTLIHEYIYAGASSLAGATRLGPVYDFTRASQKTRFNVAKTMETLANDIPALDHDRVAGTPLGIRPEGQGANQMRNSDAVGGSTSTQPTFWSFGNVANTTLTVVDYGASPIHPDAFFMDIRVQVSGGNGAFNGFFEGGRGVVLATVGQLVSQDMWYQKISGPGGFVGTTDFGFHEWDASTVFIGQAGSAISSPPDDLTHVSVNRATVNAAVASISPRFTMANIPDTTDMVLRFTLPHTEIGVSFYSSYMPTTSVGVVRSADVMTASIAAPSALTRLLKGRTPLGIDATDSQVMAQWDDGTEAERLRVERNPSREIHVIATTAGGADTDLNLGTVADDTDFTVVFRAESGNFGATLDGAVVVPGTGAMPTGLDTDRLGGDTAGEEWYGTIAEDARWNEGKADATLRAMAG